MSDISAFAQQQAKYVHDPIKWAYDLLGFEPNSFQKEALQDYIGIGHCAWSTGSGVGKTALLAVIILHFLSTRPYAVVGCTAPTENQLHNALWAEIHRWMKRSELLSRIFVWTAERIYFKGQKESWFAVAATATPRAGSKTAEGLQGLHAEHILYVVDECSGCPDQILGAIDGNMSTPNAKSILASNPTRNTGYFYNITTNPIYKQLWAVRFVDAEQIDAPYIDKKYIERLKVLYGEDSDYFRMRVRGLPPRTEYNALISPEQVFEAHSRKLQPSGHKFLSCDPARFGQDDSVFYVRDGNVVVERVVAHGLDVVQVSRVGIDLFNIHDPEEYRIDCVGIGAGVEDYTKSELKGKRSKIIGVHVGEKAVNENEFKNKRAEIMWNLRTVIDHLSIPIDTPLLDEELIVIKYGWDSMDKKLVIESKDSIRSSLGRSPNDADSLGLNCASLKTPNAIVSKKYFTIGQTNPINPADIAITNLNLNATLNNKGKISRPGVVLRAIFGQPSPNVGINRYSEFKSDLQSINENIN